MVHEFPDRDRIELQLRRFDLGIVPNIRQTEVTQIRAVCLGSELQIPNNGSERLSFRNEPMPRLNRARGDLSTRVDPSAQHSDILHRQFHATLALIPTKGHDARLHPLDKLRRRSIAGFHNLSRQKTSRIVDIEAVAAWSAVTAG